MKSVIIMPHLVIIIILYYIIYVDGRQEHDKYEKSSDVRAQLKFFEQLDHLEKQRKEEQEREILLKAAKVQCRWQTSEYCPSSITYISSKFNKFIIQI